MTGKERYEQLLRTDPSDPLVAEEIRLGIRQSDGYTDIQRHLPFIMGCAKGNILEIGTRQGTSTAAFLAGVEIRGGHVYSIDTDSCNLAHHFLGGNPNWTFIQRDSKDVEYINKIIPAELNLLFVDGDHTYEGCLADLKNYGPRAKAILVHDVENGSAPGVREAVEDYFDTPKCRHFMISILKESHGLAVLQ